MAFLAYQFPDGELEIFKGKWLKEDLNNLPEECFFVSTFTKEETFYFVEDSEVTEFEDENLSFNSEDDLFFVNGRAYLRGLEGFIGGFEPNGIQKAIYSRIKFEEGRAKNVQSFLKRLSDKYRGEAMVYLISDPQFGTWVGATPEILLFGNSDEMQSVALAGTKSEEAEEWTDKEIEEHQYVIDHVRDNIQKHNPTDLEIFPTKTVKNGAVYHLKTEFKFKVSSDNWNELMQDLHPTPAVGGTPSELAQRYILTFEPHERKFYTGLIGLKKKDNLSVFVNLRCMQILKEGYGLYVGGGITTASDIGAEWRETEAKSQTLLSVINSEK